MRIRILALFLASITIVYLSSGCRSFEPSQGAWFSYDDLKRLKSFAMASFTNDHTLLPTETPGDPVVHIRDWRTPVITIYIPIHTTRDRLMFVYYVFTGLDRQPIHPTPLSLAKNSQQFMVSEFGTVTPDGYRVPLTRRQVAPVLATPPTKPGS